MKTLTFLLAITLFSTLTAFSQTEKLVISEFMAINDTTLADEDLDYPDWIEIFNPGAVTIDLDGWYLTDNPLNIPKWRFPKVSILAGEYLVVFASEKDTTPISGNLHTNFKLSGSGEFLALVEPDGSTISSYGDTYPAQQKDVSFGLFDGEYIQMKKPTPGAENILDGYISKTIFSHERGFYTLPFDITLSNVGGNYDIFYTTNGSRPTLVNGTKYTAPFTIDTTTVLSAVTIDKTTLKAGDIVSQTYLFAEQILAQPSNPEGYTAVWGEGYPADYEMDPEICTPANKAKLIEALKSLPTVSLVTDYNHLFYDSDSAYIGGLYMNSRKHTEEWERPVSFEYFDSAQNKQFQINCGLRIHGGNGRKPGNSPKHSFRVSFRSDYGASKLNFNVFDEKSATNEFNALVFRAGYNYSWLKNSPTQCEGTDYVRDPFTKQTQLDMDRTAAHSKFAHLYLNGLYWGVYDISEKITNDFAESYLGGNEDDFDVVKDHNEVTDGNDTIWKELLAATSVGFESNTNYFKVQGKNDDGSINPAYANLLDVRNLADYILINFYIANGDWDSNNWLAVRNRVTNEEGFKFFCWDAETSMNDLNENIVDRNNVGNPTGIFTELQKNNEFKLYFADRIHKHFFNGGALTAAETEARYMNIANEAENSMWSESARWGDYRRDVDPGSYTTYELYTKENHWDARVDMMDDTYLPQRRDIVLNQLINENFYSNTDAPVFSPFGGEFESSVDLSITATAGTIYYTIDNTDPRQIGGTLAATALQYSSAIEIDEETIIKARAKNGNDWSALTRARYKFRDSSKEDTTIIRESICQGEDFSGFTTSGTYFITETSSAGADSIVELQLTVNTLPEVFIGKDTSIVLNKTINLESNSDFSVYKWNTNETSKSIDVLGSNLGENSYWLQVEDSKGCLNSDTIKITVKAEDINTIVDENFTDQIKVYPNPIRDNLQIEFVNAYNSEIYIEINALNGMRVYSNQISSDYVSEQINLEYLAQGIYFLKIRTRNSEKVFKIVKE